jgi:hypothetical protein
LGVLLTTLEIATLKQAINLADLLSFLFFWSIGAELEKKCCAYALTLHPYLLRQERSVFDGNAYVVRHRYVSYVSMPVVLLFVSQGVVFWLVLIYDNVVARPLDLRLRLPLTKKLLFL